MSYEIVEGPLPVEDYLSTLTVTPDGDGCRVSWSGRFRANGVPDEKACEIITGIYTAGLDALAKRFG